MKYETVLSYENSSILDKYTQDVWGFSSEFLMAIAAKTFLETYADLLRDPNNHITILCGRGNNGGDGYALGYFLKTENIPFTIYCLGDKTSETAFIYKNKLKNLHVTIHSIENLLADLKSISKKTILIDCLLGTGMRLPIDQELKELFLNLINWKDSSNLIFGISMDVVSGRPAFAELNKSQKDIYFPADSLAEIGVAKWENLGFPIECKKTLTIGFPIDEFLQTDLGNNQQFIFRSIERNLIFDFYTKSLHGHKYSSGSLVAIGGDEGMIGAILLSINAFVGLGGGIAKAIVFDKSNILNSVLDNPSLMISPWSDELYQDPFLAKAKVMVIGPGTTPQSKYKEKVLIEADEWCKKDSHRWVILDAGMLPTEKEIEAGLKFEGNWILTPHFGELQRMSGASISDLTERKTITQNLAKKLNAFILAKDSLSLFVSPDSEVLIWDHPNPKLSTMGTGDILTGILAVSLAKGLEIRDAVLYSLSLMNLSKDMNMISPTSWDILNFLKKG
ncbi:bifunctional ADP-dependent NAD(P)H-hydrate dehydratase/NAD(P)H-hydrate epimerase [Leptospira sp. GIMC2001]|uniref:bifunctional ADP-dependent NAD(P)H-hydrate dehydratase/NAD(P)H-hydrate epimerase n=1 Tax=Leptospira sp. GIMC2001 TaxID=1513297 RepID=UPI00234A7A3B|nr:bifunctional ADP-dependent NAD(P)H-hydrate dehydratase/NAD(P)H-hydrate epimerase [Leptospira sp. GIMC2001]WCL48093.1 bifunctional ADP-dependent NAD(P)H-hydrate dehydratase/NAD(P)H-hydrate epimerase [Leptospira sp. GIMC2001]